MARTGRVNHVHQYYRHTNGMWHCSGIDGCSHYVPKNLPPPVGRPSVCWRCESNFMLDPENMKRDKPYCDSCLSQHEMILSTLADDDDMDKIERALRLSREKMMEKPTPIPKYEKIVDEVEVIEPEENE